MEQPPPPVNIRRLIIQTGVVTVLLVVAFGAASFFARDWLLSASGAFVRWFGGPGIWLGWTISDAFPIPIIPDAFSAAGLLGGLSFTVVGAWACSGSLSGGLAGYWLGRRLAGTERYRRTVASTGVDIEGFVKKHGPWALAVAALTPLPYSAASWVCGAGHVKLPVFVAVSMLRVVRVGGYLWLLKAGVVDML